jgi:hypothetical protein
MSKRKKRPNATLPDVPPEPLVVKETYCGRCGVGPLTVIWSGVHTAGQEVCEACYFLLYRHASPKAIQTPTNPERG